MTKNQMLTLKPSDWCKVINQGRGSYGDKAKFRQFLVFNRITYAQLENGVYYRPEDIERTKR